jgi:hypothetical protein
MRWAICIPNAMGGRYIGFIIRCAIIFPIIWIIQVAMPFKPIIGDRNAFMCAIIILFPWMTIHSPNLADI